MPKSTQLYQFELEVQTIKEAIANMTETQVRQVFKKVIHEQFPNKGMSAAAKQKFIADANRVHALYGIITSALVETKIPNRQFIALLKTEFEPTEPSIRGVYITPELGEMIQAYLEERTDEEPYLFLTVRGKALSERGLQNMTAHIARKAGYEATVTPRMLVN